MEQLTREEKKGFLMERMALIGPLVKEVRKKRKWSQSELAFYIDTSTRIIQHIENDPTYNPTLSTLLNIARVLNTKL